MKSNPKLIFLLTVFSALFLVFSCGDDEDDNPVADCSVSSKYAADVEPILKESCAIANCHVDNFANGDYTVFEQLKATATNGTLKTNIEDGIMPPSNTAGPKSLTNAQKNIILCWIEEGALDN